MGNINILTYWGVPNYGGWTQAYALNKIANKICFDNNINKEIKHIDYLEESHWNNYYKNDTRLLDAFTGDWNLIPHTDSFSSEDIEKEKFDTVVLGGDSIWSFEHFCIKPDLHLMGDKINANNIHAYAVSCDELELSDVTYEMKKTLKQLNIIAVRDIYTKSMLENCGIYNVEIVLDPALLWDFRNDEDINIARESGYIAVYGCAWTEDFIKNAKKIASEKNLKLISLGYINDWCDESIKMIDLRALEWISKIGNAEMVFTSTFHGLMVGINLRKKILFNQVSNVKNRSQTLLNVLKVREDLKCPDIYCIYEPFYEDYLKIEQRYSLDVLKRIIKDEDND